MYYYDIYSFAEHEIHSDEDLDIFSAALFVGATSTLNPDDYYDYLKPLENPETYDEQQFHYQYTDYFVTRLHQDWSMVPMTFPYGEQMNDFTTLNQGQIEALAIRYGMNKILWDLAESEEDSDLSITADYMSQFDCCNESDMNVQDLVTLLNYTFEAV